ncbi:MAG: hypothetical protein SVY10_07580 [Thermodesulfobacteriota bacterium]|nr:hypothetical protein [Thermodesulfobacteriota bacterium]
MISFGTNISSTLSLNLMALGLMGVVVVVVNPVGCRLVPKGMT